MKVNFSIAGEVSDKTVKEQYCKQCRNYQFDEPVKIYINIYSPENNQAPFTEAIKGLDGIAWIHGLMKEMKISHLASPYTQVDYIIETEEI